MVHYHHGSFQSEHLLQLATELHKTGHAKKLGEVNIGVSDVTPTGKIENTEKRVIIVYLYYVNTQYIISLRAQIVLFYKVFSFVVSLVVLVTFFSYKLSFIIFAKMQILSTT